MRYSKTIRTPDQITQADLRRFRDILNRDNSPEDRVTLDDVVDVLNELYGLLEDNGEKIEIKMYIAKGQPNYHIFGTEKGYDLVRQAGFDFENLGG